MKIELYKTPYLEFVINTNDYNFYINNKQMIEALKEIFSGYDELLNLKSFLRKHKNSQISKDLFRLMELLNARDPKWHPLCGSLYFTLTCMQDLKNSNLHAYKSFLRDIRKQSSSESWKGLQFEISTARTLSLKSLEFIKNESPDFIVKQGNNEVSIECGSVRVNQDKGKSLEYKIESVINKKNLKKYANADTSLHIDITNIAHHDINNGRFTYFDSLCKKIKARKDVKFGAIILLITFSDNNGYGEGYKTLKTSNCSHNLDLFLDSYFPSGDFPLSNKHKVPKFI